MHALSITTEGKVMEINREIEEYLNSNEVCLFMKGTPELSSMWVPWLYQIFLNILK